MRGRILKTITTITLAGIMLVAGSGCGSNQPTTTASSTPTVDVIKQIEEDCGVQSERGKELVYRWWSNEGEKNTAQCLLNHMPQDVYDQYAQGVGDASEKYMDGGSATYSDYTSEEGYRYEWTVYYIGGGTAFKTFSILTVTRI